MNLKNQKIMRHFLIFSKKIGTIKKNQYKPPKNYKPGQRSQDLKDYYFENGSIYRKTESVKW